MIIHDYASTNAPVKTARPSSLEAQIAYVKTTKKSRTPRRRMWNRVQHILDQITQWTRKSSQSDHAVSTANHTVRSAGHSG